MADDRRITAPLPTVVSDLRWADLSGVRILPPEGEEDAAPAPAIPPGTALPDAKPDPPAPQPPAPDVPAPVEPTTEAP